MRLDVVALLSTVVIGTVLAVYIAARLGRILNFRSLLLLNFVAVYPLSGLVHLAHIRGVSRGYVDIGGAYDPAAATATFATVVAAVGLYPAVLAGLRRTRPSARRAHHDWIRPADRRILLTVGLIVLPVSLWASVKVHSYAANFNQARIIGLSDGLARFSFLSNWFVWAVVFGAILLLANSRSTVSSVAVLAASALLIASSLAWSGGRSVLLVMLLPVICVVLDRMRGSRVPPLALGLLALLYWTNLVTQARARDQRIEIGSWASGLDWQWGRFSMFGFAERHVSAYSPMHGETFSAAAMSVVNSVGRLVGLPPLGSGARSSMAVAGQDLLGDPGRQYIVPGLGPELFLNFGYVGVLVGFAILGMTVARVDTRYAHADGAISALAWAYVGSLLVLRTLTSDSATFWVFLFFTGAPLLVTWGWSSFLRGREMRPGREHVGDSEAGSELATRGETKFACPQTSENSRRKTQDGE